MDIIDNRPRDWAYLAAFDSKELPSLQQMIKHINETHDGQLIEDFNARCEQKIKQNDPSVVKSNDLVVNVGLQQCINIILGTSATRWKFIEIGTGTTAPSVAQTSLVTFAGAIDVPGIGGWAEAVGMKLFFGGIVGESSSGAITIREMGVFHTLSAGSMLNRNMFTNNPITSQTPKYVLIFSSVIEFCPVA